MSNPAKKDPAMRDPRAKERTMRATPARLLRVAEWRGLDSLREEELVALLLGPAERNLARAEDLLRAVGSLRDVITFTPSGLARASGLRKDLALRLLCALELGRRASQTPARAVPPGGPLTKETVASWALPRLAHLEHEEVWVLTVDARARLRSTIQVGRGGAHGCALLPQDILTPVVRAGALGFVLVHNHPSGDPHPSPEDLALTEAVRQAGSTLGTPLLDHVIVGRDGYLSLHDQGHLAA
jgi:DNA repair protein RadC